MYQVPQHGSHETGGGRLPREGDLEATPMGEQAMLHAAANGGKQKVLDSGNGCIGDGGPDELDGMLDAEDAIGECEARVDAEGAA